MKNYIISFVLLLALTACSSNNNSLQSLTKSKKHEKTGLVGELILQHGEFIIGQKLLLKLKVNSKKNSWKSESYWTYSVDNLYPTFNKSRFTCQMKNNKCKFFQDIKSPFVKVNAFKSGYGDTLSQRSNKKELSTSDVLGKTFIGVAAGALYPLTVVVGGAIAVDNFNKGGSIYKEKYVEFDYDGFVSEVSGAITKEYGSFESYLTYMVAAKNALTKLDSYAANKEFELSVIIQKYNLDIKWWSLYGKPQKIQLTPYGDVSLPSNGDIESSTVHLYEKIDDYFIKEQNSTKESYLSKLKTAKKQGLKHQKTRYNRSQSLHSLEAFINDYKGHDLANLIPGAKARLKKIKKNNVRIAAENKKRQKRIANENQITQVKLRISQAKKLKKWQSGLIVGSMTFCGRVIERNESMIKIAINAKLQGYNNEQWLHISEVYEPHKGCINKNGDLFPQF